ncbi:MAG: Pycsar system effector family protein [Cyclobacteriaceae bacterium]
MATPDLNEGSNFYKKKYKKLKKKAASDRTSERQVVTWFHVTSTNLYSRRQILDTKAGLMITVNSIIISVLIGTLYTEVQGAPELLFGLIPMVIANVVSIFFAVLATRPALANGTFSREDIKGANASLNTFDDFYRMEEEEYRWGVNEIIKTTKGIQNSYLKENYRLGIDLGIRYKRMKTSYHAFLTGLILSLTGFAVCQILLAG